MEEAALLEKIVAMDGEWLSPARREKLVAAKGFPAGWTVVVALKSNGTRCFIEFKNYVSPDGKSWPSFEAASRYLTANLDVKPLYGLYSWHSPQRIKNDDLDTREECKKEKNEI